MWPGILVQRITTRQPTDDMIEVAIVAMEEALRADGQPLPDGAGRLEREPLDRTASAPASTATRASVLGDEGTAVGEAGATPARVDGGVAGPPSPASQP